MKVVVTGGTGFVGQRLKKIRSDWVYLSSKDYDLVSTEDCKRMINPVSYCKRQVKYLKKKKPTKHSKKKFIK